MTTGGGGSRRSLLPLPVSHAVAALVMIAVVVGGSTIGMSPAEARLAPSAVKIDVQVGYGGTAPTTQRLPARVRLSADRSRRLDVEVSVDQFSQPLRFEVETVAGETVDLDLVVPGFTSTIDVVARDGGQVVGRTSKAVQRDDDLVVAGAAPSLHTGRTSRVDLLGGTATAQLIDVTFRDLGRPGFLDGLGQLVLGPQDADDLDSRQKAALGHWVAKGNVLSLDMAPSDPIPGLDLSLDEAGSALGPRLPVGAGWVVFSGGAAAAQRWSDVLEPRQIDPATANFGGGPFGFGGPSIAENMMGLPLVRQAFPSGWLVALIAFGSIVVLGPMLWLVLRTPQRRVRMWVAAPAGAVVVTALTATLGGGQLDTRATRAVTTAEIDRWGWSGDVVAATIRGTELAAPPDAVVVSTTTGIRAIDRGGAVTISPSGGDEYGVVALAGITGERPVGIEVRAELDADHAVHITVVNESASRLAQIQVSGWGQTTAFPDVPAGATKTQALDVGRPRGAFGPALLTVCAGPTCGMSPSFAQPGTRNSTGVVRVSGLMRSDQKVIGASENLFAWGTNVAVQHRNDGARSTADALRIDALGPVRVTEVDQTGTIVEGQDDTGGTIRLIAPADRPAQDCAVHTAVTGLRWWDGAAWVPIDPVGEAFDNPRMSAPNEVRMHRFPALRAGVPLYVRATQLFDANGVAMAIDCGARA